jgi:hypothetical protein
LQEYSESAHDIPFRLGIRVGIIIILSAWIVWDVLVDFVYLQGDTSVQGYGKCHKSEADLLLVEKGNRAIANAWFTKDFPVYRGMFSIIFWLWCWSAVLYLWKTFRINYLFIFQLDPHLTATATETMWVASDLSIVLLASFLVHFKVLRCDFPRSPPLGFWPLVPFIAIIYKSLNPWLHRKPGWNALWHCMVAPTVEVTFLTNYVGDVLTSLVKPFTDIAYSVCYFVSGDFLKHLGAKGYCETLPVYLNVVVPVIVLLPYWLRLMQCMRRYFDSKKRHPNLSNAFKYALSLCIICIGQFHPELSREKSIGKIVWTCSYMTSTLYGWFWDITMDWSVIDLGEPGYLRKRRMLGFVGYYYSAIAIDLILRLFWVYTIVPLSATSFLELGNAIAPFAAFAEIFRRSMWSVMRLENEHINNTAGNREIKYFPLHFDLPAVTMSLKGAEASNSRFPLLIEMTFFVAIVLVIVTVAILH